jgi:hypothetical protein
MNIAPIDRSKLAKNGDEYLALIDSDADWIVRAPEDLGQLREPGDGPFAKLPEADFRAFVDELEFKRGGVAGGSYKPLMASLTLTEIYQVFERFGWDREYTLETHDAECVGTRCESTFTLRFCSTILCGG